ncbi:MAG: Cell division protein FtsL [Candidatus Moranbacteria bacterium GW2011_GWE1_36_7]|nr:MAG: Cell division protein FtsL [Candidatus Moranbacteria bacterium GW2011_GWD2_36_12]KKQ06091.1 MAG: Cell division protein FtsL [Candidatus Moranbacteria bacterium GW2011_GWE2_36_40]KKQ14967.1 MAG: Cell division protein FtsL [Candidatus Moranbacteria bacterium GW2011_GWE1_36_7]
MTKKKFSSIAFLFIAGIGVAIFISSSAVREAYRSRKIESEVIALKQEAQRVQDENKSLSQRIAYFETPEFQEKVAKEKLNLQKSDENVVVVKQGVQQQNTEPEKVEENKDENIPNYLKWWNSFFRY